MISRRLVLAGAAYAPLAACGALVPEANAEAYISPPLPPHLSGLGALALTRPDGTPTTLSAELSPGPAVISLWATWCAPCVQEARHLARLRESYRPDQLNIVGVNVDRERDEARIAQFLEQGRVNFAQVRGDAATYAAFGQGAALLLPRLFVFDAEGRPVAAFGRYFGGETLRAIDRAVAMVLA